MIPDFPTQHGPYRGPVGNQLRDLTYTLAAGAWLTDQELPFAATSWRIVSASGNAQVTVKVEGQAPVTRGAGQGASQLAPFQKLSIKSTVDQTVVIAITNGREYTPPTIQTVNVTANMAPGNTANGPAPVTVPVATAGSPNTPSYVQIAANANRLSITFKASVNNAGTVWVTDSINQSTMGAGMPLEPGETLTLANTAIIALRNDDTANAATVHQIETEQV